MITRSIFTFAFFLTCITNSVAQRKSEFTYFSGTIGLTHSIGTFHEVGETSKAYITNLQYEQLISNNKFLLSYKVAYNLGLYFNHDLNNKDMGLAIGFHYQNYPYKSSFLTGISELQVSESTNIHTVSLPVYFKFGKKFYEAQRYFFCGAQINFHFKGKQFYEHSFGHTSYYLSRQELNDFSLSFFLGFNYKIFNIKIEYLPSNMIKKSPVEVIGLSDYEGHANHFIFINTNINIPLNPWTFGRNEHYLKHLFRRILK